MKMKKRQSVTLKQDLGFFLFSFQIITTHLMIADTSHIYTPCCDLLPNNFFVTFLFIYWEFVQPLENKE